MRLRALLAGVSIAAWMTGCGGGGSGTTGKDGSVQNPDASTVVDAGPTPDAMPVNTQTVRIITSDYSIPAGGEFYNCQRLTIPNDMYILKVTPVSPPGIHHEVFAIDPMKAKPDGLETHCEAIGLAWKPLFASGINSPTLIMPAKVALKVSAGDQIVLNLHLFNATSGTLTGTAALDVVVATGDTTGYELAGVPFVGPPPVAQLISVPAAPAAPVVTDSCTVNIPTKFFAVFPHMHKTGIHIKVTTSGSGGDQVVWDNDYDFMDQRFGQFPEIALAAGDKINVTCTYNANGTPFGDSTTQEMCFAISYLHPAIATTGGTPFCTSKL